jgi:hypothetical protein
MGGIHYAVKLAATAVVLHQAVLIPTITVAIDRPCGKREKTFGRRAIPLKHRSAVSQERTQQRSHREDSAFAQGSTRRTAVTSRGSVESRQPRWTQKERKSSVGRSNWEAEVSRGFSDAADKNPSKFRGHEQGARRKGSTSVRSTGKLWLVVVIARSRSHPLRTARVSSTPGVFIGGAA